MKLTMRKLRCLLSDKFGGVLKKGIHDANGSGEVCVRELRAYALGLRWSDHPDREPGSAIDRVCWVLNDADWSNDAERTEGCLQLAMLTEADASPGWTTRYAERTLREILQNEGTTMAIHNNLASAEETAAWAARIAVACAAGTDRGDKVLKTAVKILVECHHGA